VRSIGRVLGWTTAAAAAALALGACGGGSGGTSRAALDDGLRRDLQLAAASSVELAAGGRDRQAARFVSAVEGAPRNEGNDVTRADRRGTARHRAPTRGVRRVAESRPAPAAEVAPAETPATIEAPAAVVASIDEAPAPAPAETPAPSPEPEHRAAGGPSAGEDRGQIDEGRRGRRGNGGGWIGVVIRGGGVGDIDHCERDMPGRRGGGVLVNRRFPGLPSGGWGGPLGGRVGAVINQVATRR
jgi:hypothetical protein